MLIIAGTIRLKILCHYSEFIFNAFYGFQIERMHVVEYLDCSVSQTFSSVNVTVEPRYRSLINYQ